MDYLGVALSTPIHVTPSEQQDHVDEALGTLQQGSALCTLLALDSPMCLASSLQLDSPVTATPHSQDHHGYTVQECQAIASTRNIEAA